MAHFFDLPSHLREHILIDAVRIRCLTRGLRLSLVCKDFDVEVRWTLRSCPDVFDRYYGQWKERGQRHAPIDEIAFDHIANVFRTSLFNGPLAANAILLAVEGYRKKNGYDLSPHEDGNHWMLEPARLFVILQHQQWGEGWSNKSLRDTLTSDINCAVRLGLGPLNSVPQLRIAHLTRIFETVFGAFQGNDAVAKQVLDKDLWEQKFPETRPQVWQKVALAGGVRGHVQIQEAMLDDLNGMTRTTMPLKRRCGKVKPMLDCFKAEELENREVQGDITHQHSTDDLENFRYTDEILASLKKGEVTRFGGVARNGDRAMVRALTEENHYDPGSKEAGLRWSARIGHVEMSRYLLPSGAATDLSRRSSAPRTAVAGGGAGPEVIKLLLDAGASWDCSGSSMGWSITSMRQDSELTTLALELENAVLFTWLRGHGALFNRKVAISTLATKGLDSMVEFVRSLVE